MILNNDWYKFLKWFCIIASPAICTLLVTLSNIWHWNIPTDAIVGTIAAITTFIGVLIGISNYNYNREETEDEL